MKNGKPVLEFVAVQRRDTGEWAIPGVGQPYDILLSFASFPPEYELLKATHALSPLQWRTLGGRKRMRSPPRCWLEQRSFV